MVNGSNGAGDGASFLMPPAPGDGIFGMPQAPGDAPILDTKVPMLPPPPEHRTAAPGPPPETVGYEGGGIFAVSTPGPAEEDLTEEGQPASQSQGYDFNPEVALAPPMAAMSPTMMQAPPMAAPAMPDIGPPPTHGGVLGQVDQGRGTLGYTVIAAAGGAAAGLYYGGVWGALAGSLFGGAAVSAFRALKHVKDGTDQSDKEAVTSGTYAVGAAAIGGVIWAKLVEPQAGYARNKPRRKKQSRDVLENADACSIRPVGP
jgi:hypothetical protein